MTESNRKRATPLKRMVRGGLSKSIEPTVDWPFVTPWTVAYQAPPSVGFSRQEYWSGLPLAIVHYLSRVDGGSFNSHVALPPIKLLSSWDRITYPESPAPLGGHFPAP